MKPKSNAREFNRLRKEREEKERLARKNAPPKFADWHDPIFPPKTKRVWPTYKLTQEDVITVQKPGLKSDGDGLYIFTQVFMYKSRPDKFQQRTCSHWYVRYQWQGKRKAVSLGPLYKINLEKARKMRDIIKQWAKEGRDPIEYLKTLPNREKMREAAIMGEDLSLIRC